SEGLDLVEQHRVGGSTNSVEDGDGAGQLLQQGADGSDADTTGDEQRRPPDALRGGEGTVRPLDEDPAADRHVAQAGAGVADRFDGQPEESAVRSGRQGERVGPPPTVVVREPPEAELASPRG